jgi:hypothetical protein
MELVLRTLRITCQGIGTEKEKVATKSVPIAPPTLCAQPELAYVTFPVDILSTQKLLTILS